MENIAEMRNMGAGEPLDFGSSSDALVFDAEIGESNVETVIEHVRAPELRRNGTKLLMIFSAVVGAAAGARLLWSGSGLSEEVMSGISQTFVGSFWIIFLRQLLIGAVFLAAEFITGFFAFGDVLVWTAPYLCAMGGVLRIAASSPKMIPSAVICLAAVTAGAACSAELSGMLLRLSRGGTVYIGNAPRRKYAFEFLGCLAAVILSAILAGALS